MNPTAIGSSITPHQNVDAAGATAPTPEQKKAARDFEAIFLRQLLSSLEKGSGIAGGESSGGQVFRSMMVSALADTASEGGGIGLGEVILKAMLPPPPRGELDLSQQTKAPHAARGAPSHESSPLTGTGLDSSERRGADHVEVGEPSSSTRWGAASRVLTEARPAPMLEGATGSAAPAREGRIPSQGSGR